MGEMAVMDKTGDTKLMWNPDNDFEVDNAKEMFDKYKKKGYAAFHVKSNGDQSEIMHKFDAEAGRVIFVPPMAGG